MGAVSRKIAFTSTETFPSTTTTTSDDNHIIHEIRSYFSVTIHPRPAFQIWRQTDKRGGRRGPHAQVQHSTQSYRRCRCERQRRRPTQLASYLSELVARCTCTQHASYLLLQTKHKHSNGVSATRWLDELRNHMQTVFAKGRLHVGHFQSHTGQREEYLQENHRLYRTWGKRTNTSKYTPVHTWFLPNQTKSSHPCLTTTTTKINNTNTTFWRPFCLSVFLCQQCCHTL